MEKIVIGVVVALIVNLILKGNGSGGLLGSSASPGGTAGAAGLLSGGLHPVGHPIVAPATVNPLSAALTAAQAALKKLLNPPPANKPQSGVQAPSGGGGGSKNSGDQSGGMSNKPFQGKAPGPVATQDSTNTDQVQNADPTASTDGLDLGSRSYNPGGDTAVNTGVGDGTTDISGLTLDPGFQVTNPGDYGVGTDYLTNTQSVDDALGLGADSGPVGGYSDPTYTSVSSDYLSGDSGGYSVSDNGIGSGDLGSGGVGNNQDSGSNWSSQEYGSDGMSGSGADGTGDFNYGDNYDG